MKKSLFMFAIILMALTSCSNERIAIEQETTPQETEISAYRNDPTILRLTTLNDSLIATQYGSRSIWSFFKKVCKVAYADIKGAAAGFAFGTLIGGPTGAGICATICAVGASADEGEKVFASRSACFSQSDIELAYVNTICNPNVERDPDNYPVRMDYEIPDEFKSCIQVGVIHNLTLNTLRNGEPYEYGIEDGLTQEELVILHSDVFQNQYADFMNDETSFDMDYSLSNNTKEEYIVQLFLDVYKKYPLGVSDVSYIINEYSNIVENDSTLTFEQKRAIFTALSVAAYSTEYWDAVLNGNE